MGAFLVHALAVRFNDLGGHFAAYFQHSLVVFDGILIIDRRIGILIFVGKIVFTKFHDSLHERMIQVKTNFRPIGIIVCHNILLILSSAYNT